MTFRMRRTPFYGEAVDRQLLGSSFKSATLDEMADYELPSDIPAPTLEPADGLNTVVIPSAGVENGSQNPGDPAGKVHENYREIGAAIPLGFIPHRGENRTQRRAAVANWAPPKPTAPSTPEDTPAPRMPTRRELWEQRKRQRRGTLDPELRRLQRAKAASK